MVFTSPLDRLAFLYASEPDEFVSKILKNHKYEGTLGTVIDDLHRILATDSINGNTLTLLALHSARIVRAALDAGEYREEATKAALAAYQRRPNARALIHELREKAARFPVIQPLDKYTAQYTHPCYTRKTIKSLEELAKKGPVLFIALGNGGILPGIDVFTHYIDRTQTDSLFYPVRYSRRKKNDTRPQLNNYTAIQEYSHGREIVIFDEDVCSGATIGGAYSFFAQKVFSYRPIILLSNDALTNEKGLARKQHTYGFPDFAEYDEQYDALELMAELDQEQITDNIVSYIEKLSQTAELGNRTRRDIIKMLQSYKEFGDFQGLYE